MGRVQRKKIISVSRVSSSETYTFELLHSFLTSSPEANGYLHFPGQGKTPVTI
jgi:hypothetical protein